MESETPSEESDPKTIAEVQAVVATLFTRFVMVATALGLLSEHPTHEELHALVFACTEDLWQGYQEFQRTQAPEVSNEPEDAEIVKG